jgi:splicing factor 3A subunit 3
MASTLLEETRQQHEDMERLERLIVEEFKRETRTHKEKLMQGYRVRQMLDTLQQRAKGLANIYEDADGAREQEIASLRGDDVFSNFYDRLKYTRDYHRKFGGTDELTGPENGAALLGSEPQLSFSGEEGMGRFLDLHELHQAWQNAKFGGPIDYSAYVAALPEHLTAVQPRTQKMTVQYKDYICNLLIYLESFHQRSQPLAQLERQNKRLEEEFAAQWAAGEVFGWEDKGLGNGNGNGGGGDDNATATAVAKAEDGALNLDAFDSVDELELLGADRLKAALTALGLKCGGTVRQRAERLFAVKGKKIEEIDPSLFVKGIRPAAALSSKERARVEENARVIAFIEAKTSRLCEQLSAVIADTLGRIEKRQAQTYEEMLAEAEAEEEEELPLEEEEGEEEDEYIYNPLKLPLGWDGKPIPYWLYKLHGLNLEFKCEICGGASYWGRRAFERHFKEPRHDAGMKALGIPNTRQFFEVTTITDAVTLWKSLQQREAGGFKADDDEEYEDAEGNVFNRKVYSDLQRQGLL